MGLDDLARAVAAHDDEGVERAAAVRRDIGEIVVSLHHVHLPKLDDHDVVEYDRTAKAVTTGETFDHVVDRSNDDPQ